MNQEILVVEPPPHTPPRFVFRDMEVGQYARILPKGEGGDGSMNQYYAGEIVLRTWGGWVSITDPGHTWVISDVGPQLAVYIYPPGTKFTVAQPDVNQ